MGCYGDPEQKPLTPWGSRNFPGRAIELSLNGEGDNTGGGRVAGEGKERHLKEIST